MAQLKTSDGQLFLSVVFEQSQKNSILIFVIGAMAATTHLFHFYLDGVLFRFKDPDVTRWIGPLFTVAPNISESSPEIKVFHGVSADPQNLNI